MPFVRHERRSRAPMHVALAETVLQSCLNSLNVRKLPLAVRERRSPEGRGHKSMTAGTDFAYCAKLTTIKQL